jgi:hypothetical protein
VRIAIVWIGLGLVWMIFAGSPMSSYVGAAWWLAAGVLAANPGTIGQAVGLFRRLTRRRRRFDLDAAGN